MNEYVVIYEPADDGGWGAYLPDVPGVIALGSSRQEVEVGIQQSLSMYAEEMQAMGRAVPEPLHAAGTARL